MPESRGASILRRDDRKHVVIDVPEWGARVRVYSLTAGGRAQFIRMGSELKGDRAAQLERILPWVLVETCHDDETGERLFSHQDHEALLERNPEVLDRLSEAAMDVSGLGKAAREEAGKDSAPTPIGASSSGSPSPSGDAPSPSSSKPSEATSSPSGRSSTSSSPSARAERSTGPVRLSPPS